MQRLYTMLSLLVPHPWRRRPTRSCLGLTLDWDFYSISPQTLSTSQAKSRILRSTIKLKQFLCSFFKALLDDGTCKQIFMLPLSTSRSIRWIYVVLRRSSFVVKRVAREKLKLTFVYQHSLISGARVLPPQVVEIAGIHVGTPKPVPPVRLRFKVVFYVHTWMHTCSAPFASC